MKKSIKVIEYSGKVFERNKQNVINKLVYQRHIKPSNILGVKFGKKGTRFKAYVKTR